MSPATVRIEAPPPAWHAAGFSRTLTVIETRIETIGCAVLLEGDPEVAARLCVERDCEAQVYRMGAGEADALGSLLFDAGLRALTDPEARDEALGRCAKIRETLLWVDFGPADWPLRLALHGHDLVHGRSLVPLRLTPQEAIGLGLLLIRAHWELTAAAPADAEAA